MKTKTMLGMIVLSGVLILSGCNTNETKGTNEHANHQANQDQVKVEEQVHLEWSFNQSPVANQEGMLTIQVNDHSGKPVQDFKMNHEKKMHLIVVSEDLATFEHIHPEFKGQGRFEVMVPFASAGKYKLIADFIPENGNQIVQTHWVEVQGEKRAKQSLLPDSNLTKVIDGKEITLSFDKQVKVNEEVMLNFQFKDAKSKKPITDLEPYLGAVGHVVIISEDTEKYLHVHPMDEATKGPDAKFHTTFPEKGIYKIWGQFQQNGKVFTVPFVVKVS
ncbi:hypothetical protein SAMN04487866_1287 [Thermoactinomyces sp. DSM 45891]|uniref:hypothetical protein n=1 Tax=Thermoactinomyces sp. DSM 45891 TaxID=1761907 RepID=UPI000917A18B|nr:hypothetical protein [Thermoactinomyces sp. DSM 45891]SFX80719.1 hypothetical protein SAMN04487866_1287 [Thermoactinomyces sp. DSM 45891]